MTRDAVRRLLDTRREVARITEARRALVIRAQLAAMRQSAPFLLGRAA